MWSVVLLLAATLLGTSGPRCPTQRVLTDGGNPQIFPPLVSSASATSSADSFQIQELFQFSYPDGTIFCWCTDNTESPNITISLAEPVVLYGLLSGGYYSSLGTSYVSNFTLQYSESEGGHSSQYNPLGNHLIFSVPSMGSPVLFQSPLLMTTLHLHVLDHVVVGSAVSHLACWTVALMGCLQSDAVEEEKPSLELATSSVMLAAPTQASPSPTGAVDQPCSSEARSVEENSLTVAITVPTALLSLTVVAVLVAVGVAACWKINHRERADTIEMVDNTLYHIRDKPGQVYEDVPQPELMDNPAYRSTVPNLATDDEMALSRSQNSEERADTIKMVDNSVYNIRDKPGQVYEDIPQPELMDNPAYRSPVPNLATDDEMAISHSQNSERSLDGEYTYICNSS